MSFLDDLLLDVSLVPAFPNAYNVWVDRGTEVRQLMRDWYTESRGHGPAQSDIDHMIWRLLNEPVRWGTLRAAMQSSWPIKGQEGTTPPAPLPPTTPPEPLANVDPREVDLTAVVRSIGEDSVWWPEAHAGSEIAAHRVTRQIAQTLAHVDPRWGLITKQPGQQQCTWDECGSHVRDGYGEDIVAFIPGLSREVWLGYDVIGGAGAPGARLQFVGPVDIRPGNLWAPVPPS